MSFDIEEPILCLWFRTSLIYINNCPTRCNTKQSVYYSASSLYTFRVSTTPIIRSTQNRNYSLRYWSHFLCAATSHQRGQAWPRWWEVAEHKKMWPVPEAVVTVLCTTDDGCGWHPKHVDWTCRIINRLLCIESRWTIIDIEGPVFLLRTIFILHSLSFSLKNKLLLKDNNTIILSPQHWPCWSQCHRYSKFVSEEPSSRKK